MSETIRRLPHVDEHSLIVDADRETTWEGLQRVVEASFSSSGVPPFARLLGCADTAASGRRPLAEGSVVPGFHVAAAEAPAELALAGSHRFSDYALIFRLDELGGGRTRVRAETRAEFPGLKGGVYETLVIRTRMHVLVTRRLLAAVRRNAQRR
jgi:hypothetical protein